MEVKIDQHFSAKVYTSGSTIAGHVAVRPVRDTPFDNFAIVFTGIAATRLDYVQQYPSHSFRPFMKLMMPIADSDLPADLVFKAGQEYNIPFHFVVPHQLPIGACSHKCTSAAIREHHLRLPPSLGFWEADDQAPDMTQIEYAIKVRASQRGEPGCPSVKVLEAHHFLKVLPALPEDAPLDITDKDERYKLSKTKTIRKGLFSSKTGQLKATASQPSAVMLSGDGHSTSSSTATVHLVYTPDSVETAPPKVNSVTGKLVATTYFGAAPTNRLPNLGSRNFADSSPSLTYITTNSLFTLPVGTVSWKQEKNTSSGRRDSGYSSSALADEDASEPDGLEGHAGEQEVNNGKLPKKPTSPIKHTTSLNIPFSIPNSNRKFFVPTFHSCLISRAYILQLTLCVGPTKTAISLAVPLQVGVEAMYEPQDDELPTFESVMAQAGEDDVDAHMQTRTMQFPVANVHSNSILPGYDDFSQRTVRVA